MSFQSTKSLLVVVYWFAVLDFINCFKLTILHTNDVHARIEQFNAFGSACTDNDAQEGACFGGEARRMTKVTELKAQHTNVLLLDGGDRFLGTLWFTKYKGIADSFFMNRFPYDAMVSIFFFFFFFFFFMF